MVDHRDRRRSNHLLIAALGVAWSVAPGCRDFHVAGETVEPCVGVDVAEGEDLAAIHAEHPAGTTYCIAGIHALTSSIVAKAGDVFIGAPGAILDGGGTVDVGIGSTAPGVTVRGLVVRNFGSAGVDGHDDWTVLSNEVHGNAGIGVILRQGCVAQANHVHDNDLAGFKIEGALGANILVEDNDVVHNNVLDAAGSGGIMLLGLTDGLTSVAIRSNRIRDNVRAGVICSHNAGPEIDVALNTITGNSGAGIAWTGCWAATIHDNTIQDNAFAPGGDSCWWGAQISIAQSTDVEVSGNLLESSDGSNGLCGVDDYGGTPGSAALSRCVVRDNTIKVKLLGSIGIVGMVGPYGLDHIRFERNTYYVPSVTGTHWELNGSLNADEWRAAGQDTEGMFLTW